MENNYEKLGIGGMICGIVSLILFWIPLVGLTLSFLGIILGSFGMKADKKGCAITGLITGIAGAIPAFIFSLMWIAALAVLSSI